MKKSANGNMYEVAAREVEELFASHLEGTPLPLACVISTDPLPDRARTALESSMEALGYGRRQTTFATLNGVDGSLDASSAFLLLEGLDPLCVVVADAHAASILSDAYRCDVPTGRPCRLLGRNAVAFESFDGMLDDPRDKQRAWALLKKLPHLND